MGDDFKGPRGGRVAPLPAPPEARPPKIHFESDVTWRSSPIVVRDAHGDGGFDLHQHSGEASGRLFLQPDGSGTLKGLHWVSVVPGGVLVPDGLRDEGDSVIRGLAFGENEHGGRCNVWDQYVFVG